MLLRIKTNEFSFKEMKMSVKAVNIETFWYLQIFNRNISTCSLLETKLRSCENVVWGFLSSSAVQLWTFAFYNYMSIKDFTKRSWFGLLTCVFFSLYLDFHKRYPSKLK